LHPKEYDGISVRVGMGWRWVCHCVECGGLELGAYSIVSGCCPGGRFGVRISVWGVVGVGCSMGSLCLAIRDAYGNSMNTDRTCEGSVSFRSSEKR